MPKAGLKDYPSRVTLSVTEGYSAEVDAYNQVYRYSDGRMPRSFSGNGETVPEAVKNLRSNIEAGLSKNRDKEILSLLESLDKSL